MTEHGARRLARRIGAAILLALAGCTSVRPCADGTLLLEITADAAASSATELHIDADTGDALLHSVVPYTGTRSGTLELDFPRGYPSGHRIAITVTAVEGGFERARGAASAELTDRCARIPVELLALDAGDARPLVPGGTYDRSNEAAHPAKVSSFRLDRYEITVGRFRAFVASGAGTQKNPPSAGAGTHPLIAGSGWNAAWNASLAPDTATLLTRLRCGNDATFTPSPGANEDKAINCIDWFQAFAFCVWDGGRLPTEAEWNYAAAGGNEQRTYAWGSAAPDASYAVFAMAPIAVVGSKSPKGDGRWGHADLTGNMWEWTLDGHDWTYLVPCNDCANLDASAGRVIRGGSWFSDAGQLPTTNRHSPAPPTSASTDYGARCASSP